MADHFYANITIGGDLPQSKADDFVQVIRESGAGPEPEGGIEFMFDGKDKYATGVDVLVKLLEASDVADRLRLSDCQATGGMFEALEQWCEENDLEFDRHSDPCYEATSENVYYRKGKGYITMHSDQNYGEYVDAGHVRNARDALDVGDVHSAMKALDAALGDGWKIPELPPFKIVDG